MTIQASISTKGLERAGRILEGLSTDKKRQAVRAGLQAAGEAVKANFQADAPVGEATPHRARRPGSYRRRVDVYDLRQTEQESSIRVRAFDPIAHMIEYGTEERRPRKARVMTPNPGIGGPYFGTRAAALPARFIFHRAVLRTNIDAAFVRGLNAGLEAHIKRAEAADRGG